MSQGLPLLTRLQRIIEASYDWRTGIRDLGPYLVGDEGYRTLYGDRGIVGLLPGADRVPRTLVTWRNGVLRLGVYYPNEMIRDLEERNPLFGVGEKNLIPFSLLVEELDHLLMLAWSARHGRVVRLMELEFHANITKYLVLAHFLARAEGRSRLSTGLRRGLDEFLFEGAGEDLPEPYRNRYQTAARLARRFLMVLERLAAPARLVALRRFGRRSWANQRYCLESTDAMLEDGLLVAA
jgi:hypothetical protein